MQKIIITLMLLPFPALAEITGSFTTGIDYSSGKYGSATSTNIVYVPVTGKIQLEEMFFKVTVPYIRITSSDSRVVRGVGPIKAPVLASRTTTQAGLGDIVTAAGYNLYDSEESVLDLVGNIKFGTADSGKNLGSGENDYSAQLDGFYIINKTTLSVTGGYKIIGAPEGVTVNNTYYGAIGISHKTGDTSSAGIAVDAAQGSNRLSPGTFELSIFVSRKIRPDLKIQVSLLKGYSISSPDIGGSLMLISSL